MKSVKYNKNLNKMLKTSIVTFSVLTIINCIRIVGSSNALFEKSIDSENSIKMKALDYWAKPEVATTSVTNLAKKDKINLAYDETVDNNLRYIGKDPNNYVSFNNELWRIIGVMNNIDDGTGKKEARIKLIRNNFIYNNIAFNNSDKNDYSTSSIKEKLNIEYYNTVAENSKNMIDNVVWNLGGVNLDSLTPSQLYSLERGTQVYSGNQVKWIGKIGLIYPSDFFFANDTVLCRENTKTNIVDEECFSKNYIFRSDEWQWTITPSNYYLRGICRIDNRFFVSCDSSCIDEPYSTHPSLYLKPNVKITGGYGTKNRPYTLG